MNVSNATHVDVNPGSNPGDFPTHDAPPPFPPDLYPPYGQHPQPPGTAPPGADQRRLASLGLTSTGRQSRKRKTPPTAVGQDPNAPYNPDGDFTPGGLPDSGQPNTDPSIGMSQAARPLNPGKRAEQNRKAQRAFRERREHHVRDLEARSQLLDAALSSTEEANRRWEECRQLVDQLRAENVGLRAEINNLRQALGSAAAAFQAQQSTPAASDEGRPINNRHDSPREKENSASPHPPPTEGATESA